MDETIDQLVRTIILDDLPGSQSFREYEELNEILPHIDSNGKNLSHSEESCMNFAQNISYWNVSCDTLLSYSIPLYGYCMPFLLVITVVANTLIILVLSKRTMATPTNSVLMGMALCDLLTVVFPAPGLSYMYTFGNHYKPLYPIAACVAYSTLNEILPTMFHTASIWLTLALAAQRYIYVCHAPMARMWCTMPKVKRCIFYICAAAFLHQSTRLFDQTYSALSIDWNGKEVKVCHMKTAKWVDDYVGENIYFFGYFMFRVLFVHLLPCTALVILNMLLFKAMNKAKKRRKKLFNENRQRECKKLRETNCTTFMLVIVVTVFLIVEIPVAIITAMHIISEAFIEFLDYRIANIFILLTNFFLVVSYPINFGIYCGMSRQFRTTFKEIFTFKVKNQKLSTKKCSIVNDPRTITNETIL